MVSLSLHQSAYRRKFPVTSARNAPFQYQDKGNREQAIFYFDNRYIGRCWRRATGRQQQSHKFRRYLHPRAFASSTARNHRKDFPILRASSRPMFLLYKRELYPRCNLSSGFHLALLKKLPLDRANDLPAFSR